MSSQNKKSNFLSDFMKFDSSIYQTFNGFNNNNFERYSILLNKTECPICYFVPKFPVRPNNCSHIFCSKCISKWLKTKRTCPYCRQIIDKLKNYKYNFSYI